MLTRQYLRALLVLLVVLTGVSATAGGQVTDEEYSRRIVGTWMGEYILSNGYERIFGEKTYRADGTAIGFISEQTRSADGGFAEVARQSFVSRWRISDGILEAYEIKYNPADPDEDGRVIRDLIIEIGEKRAVFESNGTRFERLRVR